MKLRWEIAWGIFFGYCLILLLSFVLAMLAFLVLRLVTPDVPMIGLGNDNATLADPASELPGLAPAAESRLSQAFEAFAGDGSAITQPLPRGAYYLDVRADAPWTIDLVPGSWPE